MICFARFFSYSEFLCLSEIQSVQTVEQNYEEVERISTSDCLAFVLRS